MDSAEPRPAPDGSATLTRALTFIERQAAQPVCVPSVSDIARASGVTPRALQLAFRKCFHVTPSEYERRLRLDSARHELWVAAGVGATTVTEVAMRWGFFHPGRFAAAYRKRFGEAPHETLSTGRPVAERP